MSNFKHLIISRARFQDKELLKKYLEVSRVTFSPSIRRQKCKRFKLAILIHKEDVELVKDVLEIEFIPFSDPISLKEYITSVGFEIQTRHDIDDWMSEDYVEKLQEIYVAQAANRECFLIQAQPTKLVYDENISFTECKEVHMAPYTERRNSMFLSLCQKKVLYGIFDRKHSEMYEICNHVVTLGEGYVKWIIHGNNITVRRRIPE